MKKASHAEYIGETKSSIVTPVSCAVPPPPGTPALNEAMPITIEPGTLARSVFRAGVIRERFTCSYEMNPRFEFLLVGAGLVISGRGAGDEARIIELPDHPYYLATLFLPQYASTPERPHRFVTAFLEAALARR